MPSELEVAKQRLRRSQILCRHIGDHLAALHQQYEISHPEFAGDIVKATDYIHTFYMYLDEVYAKLMQL